LPLLVVLEAGAQYIGVLLKVISVGGVNAGVITACEAVPTLASFTV
jgi:hypothetical protein